MSDQLSDEMGAPGYPPGDQVTEDAQQDDGAQRGDGAHQGDGAQPGTEGGNAGGDQEQTSDAMDASGAMLDTEMGGGEGDLDDANDDLIRRRAYEISQGPDAGNADENWARAEREVRTEQASP